MNLMKFVVITAAFCGMYMRLTCFWNLLLLPVMFVNSGCCVSRAGHAKQREQRTTVIFALVTGVRKHRTVRTGPKYSDILHRINSKVTKCKSEMHENRGIMELLSLRVSRNTAPSAPAPNTSISYTE